MTRHGHRPVGGADVDTLAPVSREPTAELIATQIRDRIMEGKFPAGMQLGEAQLAQRLGVSRGPVREALNRLVQEGLARSERNRGVFVRELTEADIEDVFLARRAIELAAAQVVIQAARPSVLDELGRLVESMERASTRDEWRLVADFDLAFHQSLVRGSGSTRLIRMFDTLLVETRMCLAALEGAYPSHPWLFKEHHELLEELINGVRTGDATRVRQLIESHLNASVRDLLRQSKGAHSGSDTPSIDATRRPRRA